MHKVLVTARAFTFLGDEALGLLKKQGFEIILNPLGEFNMPEEKVLPLVSDIDIYIPGEDWITERVIANAKQLKMISKVGIGVDRINISAATKKSIAVTNTPTANTQSVADLAFALLLALARRVVEANNGLVQGAWKPLIGTELWGKTIGIVGLGRIGKAVACRARGFDMQVLAHDIAHDKEFAAAHGVKYVDLDQLLRESDFISLHVPGLKTKKYLIGAEEIKLMKPEVLLINTSRGGAVDEAALLAALKNNAIAGVGTDVFEVEPAIGNPLLALPNVIATPHMSSYSRESLGRMCLYAAQNAVQVMNGEMPESILNPEIFNTQT